MSTKLGTIVKLLSGRQRSTPERLAAPESPDRRVARFGVATLTLHQGGKLSPEEGRNREATLRSKHARLAECLLIEGERDVACRGHENTCST